jgi:hypothetical protein
MESTNKNKVENYLKQVKLLETKSIESLWENFRKEIVEKYK